MEPSRVDLVRISEDASTLSERLDGQFVPLGGEHQIGQRRLARWREVTASSASRAAADTRRMEKMKCSSGVEVLALLGPVRQIPGSALPSWVAELGEIVRSVASVYGTGDGFARIDRSLRVIGRSIPYAHLYLPIAEQARSRLERSFCGAAELERSAWHGLQLYLIRRMAVVISPALHLAFLAHKAVDDSGMFGYQFAAPDNAGPQRNERRVYREFVQEQGNEGLLAFFLRYPVAGRIAAEITQSWMSFVEDFIRHFENDKRVLSASFNAGVQLGKITDIQAGASDPHNGGRTVLLLTFERGTKLVYKPRPLQIEGVFFALAREINARATLLELRVLDTVDRETYGWMEFARVAPCPNHRAARRYYRRAGNLVCLAHWLRGIDLHRENLVAAGEHPVFVDLEGLAHPWQTSDCHSAEAGEGWPFSDSVLRTGLLPLWQPVPSGGGWYEHSGLNARIDQPSFLPSAHWTNVNSDSARLDFAKRPRHHGDHRPRLAGRALSIRNYAADLLKGYAEMARLLEVSQVGGFSSLRAQIIVSTRRWIKRPTRAYNFLLQHSVQPKFLAHGVERSIELEALPPIAGANGRDAEIASLERLDIPYFCISGTDPHSSTPPSLASQLVQVRLALQRRLLLQDEQIHPLKRRRLVQPPPTGSI